LAFLIFYFILFYLILFLSLHFLERNLIEDSLKSLTLCFESLLFPFILVFQKKKKQRTSFSLVLKSDVDCCA